MEEEIKSLIEKNKYGITEHELLSKLENHTNEEIIRSLCKMESDRKIEKYSNRGTIKYRLVQLSQEESEDLINKLITQSDTAGITLNELKNKSNLPQAMVNKCIKNLQHKLLVKMVKSHKNNQKLFISFEKMPSEEITGGKWFTEGEIDEQFVNELMKVIYLFINNKTKGTLVRIRLLPTLKEIKEFITESKVTNIFLNEEDVKSLLDVMVAEGKIQEIEKENTLFYRTFY